MADLSGQYLTFVIGGEVYGANIHQVREVLEYREPMKTPQAPDGVCGVINLRGQAVSVLDLRRLFGLPPAAPTADTCIVIFETVDHEGGAVVTGALADSVREVTEITAAELEDVPEGGDAGGLVIGLARRADDFIMLLDAARLLDAGLGTEAG